MGRALGDVLLLGKPWRVMYYCTMLLWGLSASVDFHACMFSQSGLPIFPVRLNTSTVSTDVGLRALAPLGALQELGLRCLTFITDNGLKALAPLTALRHLEAFHCTGTSHECHETLREGLDLLCGYVGDLLPASCIAANSACLYRMASLYRMDSRRYLYSSGLPPLLHGVGSIMDGLRTPR